MNLHEYISSLLRYGMGDTWLPALTPEQVAMIAALANKEVLEVMTAERDWP